MNVKTVRFFDVQWN